MKFLIVCAVSASTLLGGCASTGGVPATPPNVVATIALVQSYAKSACGFVPTAATIASLLSGGNPGVMSAVSIAQAICSAINPVVVLAAGRTSASQTVNGWRVTPGKVNGIAIRGSKA